MSHVVVAPDKFKGTLTATQVAARVAAGFARVRPDLEAVQVPVADGAGLRAGQAAGRRAGPADRHQPRHRGAHPGRGQDAREAESCSASAAWPAPTAARAWSRRSAAGPLLEDLAERVARDWLVP
jgi:glycerate kinase family protein